MVRKIFIFAVACICYVLLNVDCQAELVTVEVTGVVDSISEEGGIEADGSVAIGSLMQGWCVYDTEAGDRYPEDGNYGEYPVISISMSIGNYLFSNEPLSEETPYFAITQVDPTYRVRTRYPLFQGTVYVDGVPQSFDDLDWTGSMVLLNVWTSSDEVITSDLLPTAFPDDITVFDLRRSFFVNFYPPGYPENGYFLLSGELTSIRVVPEPVSALLMGLGGLAAVYRRRSRWVRGMYGRDGRVAR